MSEWCFASVTALGHAYRDGTVTPADVVQELLGRIEMLDAHLNAFATVSEMAHEEAERATRELAEGNDRGALHGVPVAVKDLIKVRGAPTGFGSCVGRVVREEEDAVVVARLRDAGAVILGKTNLLEYAYGAVHPEVGPTLNPWDLGRTAGGSSGGSAAALAAGLAPLALGTDTGGSIRIPAAYCGVVGLKPTWGRVSTAGVFPLSQSLDAVGPMARNCADAALLLEVLQGNPRPGDFHSGDLDGAVLGIPEDYIELTNLEPGVETVFRNAVTALREAGAKIVEVPFADFASANETLLDILHPEASVIHERSIRSVAAGYAPTTRAQLEHGFTLPAVQYVRAKQRQEALIGLFETLMTGVDALLTPSVGFVAPAEDPAVNGEEGAAEMHFSGPFNLLGAPALSVPFGFSAGLPVGVQIVGRRGDDAGVLRVGAALEALAPNPLHPPPPL
ncbi:amidase [soil metagenome]